MKKCRFPSLLAAVILLAALFLPMSAAAVEDPGLTCRNAILIDATYDEVLYDKGALTPLTTRCSMTREPMTRCTPPASPR